jgi:hypothetical protein
MRLALALWLPAQSMPSCDPSFLFFCDESDPSFYFFTADERSANNGCIRSAVVVMPWSRAWTPYRVARNDLVRPTALPPRTSALRECNAHARRPQLKVSVRRPCSKQKEDVHCSKRRCVCDFTDSEHGWITAVDVCSRTCEMDPHCAASSTRPVHSFPVALVVSTSGSLPATSAASISFPIPRATLPSTSPPAFEEGDPPDSALVVLPHLHTHLLEP